MNTTAGSSQDPKTLKIFENLRLMLKKHSREQFAGFFNVEGVTIQDIPSQGNKVLGHILSSILVQGMGFRITLKYHSDLAPMVPLCVKNMQVNPNQVHERMIRDFLREVANLVAGAMRADLGRNNVDAGISLPMSTRGFDEVFFRGTSQRISTTQTCEILWENTRVVVTQLVEISEENSLDAMQTYDPDAKGNADDIFETLMTTGA